MRLKTEALIDMNGRRVISQHVQDNQGETRLEQGRDQGRGDRGHVVEKKHTEQRKALFSLAFLRSSTWLPLSSPY